MAITVTYPTNAELEAIAQDKIPALIEARPIFKILPMRNVDAALLMWEQKDNYIGLQQIRGLNGSPPRVARIGQKRFLSQPGIYGEFERIDETEITLRRPMATFTGPIPVDDLVMECQDQLLGRRLDRIEFIGWTLLATGTFSVSTVSGSVAHTDTFTLQTFSASVPWATAATATPLNDFRAVQLLARGHSVSFGANATAYMNQKTFNNLINNTNNADLYGRRLAGLSIVNNIIDLNKLLTGDGLPTVEIYDMGYLAEPSGTFNAWIPDNKVVVIGQRPAGQLVGEYLFTRNANNDNGQPGPYQRVIDDPDDIPRTIEIHDGHNGGPVIYYPSAVVVMSV